MLACYTLFPLTVALAEEPFRPNLQTDYGLGRFVPIFVFESRPEDFDAVDYDLIREDFEPLRDFSNEQIMQVLCENDFSALVVSQWLFEGTAMHVRKDPVRTSWIYVPDGTGRQGIQNFYLKSEGKSERLGVMDLKGVGRSSKHMLQYGLFLMPMLYLHSIRPAENEKEKAANEAILLDGRRQIDLALPDWRAHLREAKMNLATARTPAEIASRRHSVVLAERQLEYLLESRKMLVQKGFPGPAFFEAKNVEIFRSLDYQNGLLPRHIANREMAMAKGLRNLFRNANSAWGTRLQVNDVYFTKKLPVDIYRANGEVLTASVEARRPDWRLDEVSDRGNAFPSELLDRVMEGGFQVTISDEMVDLELPAVVANPLSELLGFSGGNYHIDSIMGEAMTAKDFGDEHAIEQLLGRVEGLAKSTPIPERKSKPRYVREDEIKYRRLSLELEEGYQSKSTRPELPAEIFEYLLAPLPRNSQRLLNRNSFRKLLFFEALFQLPPDAGADLFIKIMEHFETKVGGTDRSASALEMMEENQWIVSGLTAFVYRKAFDFWEPKEKQKWPFARAFETLFHSAPLMHAALFEAALPSWTGAFCQWMMPTKSFFKDFKIESFRLIGEMRDIETYLRNLVPVLMQRGDGGLDLNIGVRNNSGEMLQRPIKEVLALTHPNSLLFNHAFLLARLFRGKPVSQALRRAAIRQTPGFVWPFEEAEAAREATDLVVPFMAGDEIIRKRRCSGKVLKQ